ncbi:MAG: hypothetical protein V9E94_16695 [Microthrixaceae bacterium]
MTDTTGGESRTRVLIEVTDTLSIDFTTGIQRVVREVVAGLTETADFEVVPVVTPAVGAGFRTVTSEESDRLSTHPAGGRAGRRADDFGPFAAVVRRIGDLPATLRVRGAVASLNRARTASSCPLTRSWLSGPCPARTHRSVLCSSMSKGPGTTRHRAASCSPDSTMPGSIG